MSYLFLCVMNQVSINPFTTILQALYISQANF